MDPRLVPIASALRMNTRLFRNCLDGLSERWAQHLATSGDFVHRNQRRILRRCNLNWTGENLIKGTAFTPAAAVKSCAPPDTEPS